MNPVVDEAASDATLNPANMQSTGLRRVLPDSLKATCSRHTRFRREKNVLHLPEAVSYLRIQVARASRKHPMLLEMFGDGRLHLSTIAKLAPYLIEANREKILKLAVHKTKRQIRELVAEISPKPDVPEKIRKLPERREKIQPSPVSSNQLRPDAATIPAAPAPAKPEMMEKHRLTLIFDGVGIENASRSHRLSGRPITSLPAGRGSEKRSRSQCGQSSGYRLGGN